MGLADLFSDIVSSFSLTEAMAEAPPAEEPEDTNAEEGKEEEEAEEEGEEEEEEEEEEEDPEDIQPKLEEGAKHHFDDCVERVTAQQEDPDFKGPSEDCVEEFFHLQHCASQCAAPKLFRQLK